MTDAPPASLSVCGALLRGGGSGSDFLEHQLRLPDSNSIVVLKDRRVHARAVYDAAVRRRQVVEDKLEPAVDALITYGRVTAADGSVVHKDRRVELAAEL